LQPPLFDNAARLFDTHFLRQHGEGLPDASHGVLAVLVLIFQDATRIFRRAVLRPSFSPGIVIYQVKCTVSQIICHAAKRVQRVAFLS
jgi:hypothetical protein